MRLRKRFAETLVPLILIAFVFQGADFAGQNAFAKAGKKNTGEPAQDNFEEGDRRLKDKDWDGAIDSFLQAIYFSRNGFNPKAYYSLGVAYSEKKEDSKAIVALNKCIEQSLTTVPNAHLLLGQIYLRNKRFNEAEQEADKALDIGNGPPSSKAYNLLGKIQLAEGNVVGAQAQFQNALGEKPWKYTEAWVNYAETFMWEKNWGSAYQQLTALLNSPKELHEIPNEQVYLDIGICLGAKGDHQGALDNWRKVLDYNPSNYAAHLQIAKMLDSEHHISSAITEYKEYIRTASDPQGTEKAKARVAYLQQQLNPQPQMQIQRYQPPQRTPQEIEEEKRQIEKEKESLTAPLNRDSGF
jgi:tetratricopeptide (TPR) repeat protein